MKARNTRGEGSRGKNLELERRNAEESYNAENCALVCYYCNNDKSYIYSHVEYKKHFGPARKEHFQSLAKEHNIPWPDDDL